MGCGVMAELFGFRRDVREAFKTSAQRFQLDCSYRVIGEGQTFSINLGPDAHATILHTFLDVLLVWDIHRARTVKPTP